MQAASTVVDSQRVTQALEAFALSNTDDASDALCTQLGSLGVELQNRAFTKNRGAESAKTQKHWRSFARSCEYMTRRLGDLLTRLVMVRWIHGQRVASGESPGGWRAQFAKFLIKDFHADASSFMDSLAPVVAQVPRALPPATLRTPPGFSDVVAYSNSKRKDGLREGVPAEILRIVDSTDRWWPLVKCVRQFLHHREHVVIPFGHPEEGFLFQVYSDRHEPLITDAVLLWPQGSFVADFGPYSAFVVAEAVALLDDLGVAASQAFGVELEEHMLIMGGDYADVVSSLRALARRADEVSGERT